MWADFLSRLPSSLCLFWRCSSVVTGASEKGTWVRLFRPPTEGRLEHGFQGLDVGDRVRVKLLRTDVERGFIDFVRD